MPLPVFIAVLVTIATWGCSREKHVAAPVADTASRQRVIREIQEFDKSFGFAETGSFAHAAPEKTAYYRCYYTEKLRLPDSYHDLKVMKGSETGCKLDARKYDVFYYRIEAVASRKTPTTAALAQASMERLVVVVAHEDFHQQKAIRRLPASLEEASATLVGFLTAAEYAKSSQGEDSELYKNLAGEAALFSQKAEIVNRFHARLGALYRDVRARKITKEAALSEKERLFAELERACLAVTPDPSSFNECPAVMNNAGLSFDHTYTKHYGMMYRLASAHGRNLRGFLETLKGLPVKNRWPEQEAVNHIEGLIGR